MINIQMKEERLQRRKILQKKRVQRLEDESRMLEDVQMQQQHHHNHHHHWQQQQQQQQQQQLPQQYDMQHCQITTESPLRTLGRDFHNRRLGEIDPRSTISLEEDRLRGSLMRLEQRLDQTRQRKKGKGNGATKTATINDVAARWGGRGGGNNHRGGGEQIVKKKLLPMLPPTSYNPPPSSQQQFIAEEKHSHGILRYPVAQRTNTTRAAGRYNSTTAATAQQQQQQRPMQQQQRPMQQQQRAPNVMQQLAPVNQQPVFFQSTQQSSVHQRSLQQHQRPMQQQQRPMQQQQRPMQQQQQQQQRQPYHVQAPTGVHVVPGNNVVPTEIRLSYSVMPRVTTAPGRSNGYRGLNATREEAHLHRMATLNQGRAQSALPSVRTTTMRVMSSTRKLGKELPQGSLSQKPRTRRIKLGKNKVRTGGMMSGQVHVNTGNLHLLVSP